MNRSSGLILVGVVLLLVAVLTPFIWFTIPWDTKYVYSIETGDSYCADVVDDTNEAEAPDDFRVEYTNLSTTGREHFERALAEGKYVVGARPDTAPDFSFTDDNVARGAGCYAVSYEGDTYALRTIHKNERAGPFGGRWPFVLAGGLLVVGAGSLVAGVGLWVKRWLS